MNSIVTRVPVRRKSGLRWYSLTATSIIVATCIVVSMVWFGERNPKESFLRGLDAYRAGDTATLADVAVRLSKLAAFQSHHHLLRGLLLMRSQSTRDALQEFGQALGDVDTTALALGYSGEILYGVGAYQDAERMLRAAVEADATLVDAHRYLIATYYDIGAMDNALTHIGKVIELAPTDMRPWRIEGLILKDFEKYDEAIKAYLGALERSPSKPIEQEIRSELAECYLQLRRHEDALVQLAEVPPSGESMSQTTECLLALGRAKEADESLRRALQLEPGNLRAQTIEVTLSLEQGLLDAAARKLNAAIALHPRDFNLRSLAMQTFQKLGETKQADDQQAKMKELRELKDRFSALNIKAIRNPGDASIRLELGDTAVELGMGDAAVGWYKAAVAMDPNNRVAREKLTQIIAQQSPIPPGGKN